MTASRSTVARERASLQDVRRVVVKVGTHSIATKTGRPDYRALRRLVGQLCELRKSGLEVIFVSSGAVAAGVEALGLKARPTQVNDVQMCAAVGQARFISEYENLFGAAGVKIGQVLLTHADFDDRRRAANVRRSLDHLVRAGIVPVVNENDVVADEELKERKTFLRSRGIAYFFSGEVQSSLSIYFIKRRNNFYGDNAQPQLTLVLLTSDGSFGLCVA